MALIPGNTASSATLPWGSAPVQLQTGLPSELLPQAKADQSSLNNYNSLISSIRNNPAAWANQYDVLGNATGKKIPIYSRSQNNAISLYQNYINNANSDLSRLNTEGKNYNQSVYNIDSPFSQTFTPQYFDTRLGSYLNNYTPQLNSQYNQLQKNSYYQLARQGLYGSPTASEVANRNQVQYATQQNNLNSLGNDYVNGLKSDVLNSRNAIAPYSAASANPTQASKDATAAIGNLTQQQSNPTFSPLGNLFTLFSNAQGNSGNNGTFFQNNATPYTNPVTSQIFKQNAGGQAGKVVTG